MKTFNKKIRIAQLEKVMQPFRMANCKPMQDLAKEGIDLDTARVIATGYLPANMMSPQIMAAAFLNIEDEAFRLALLANLWDECGGGDINCSHVQLFKRFVIAVGLNPDDYTKPIAGSKTEKLINTYLNVCQKGPGYRALAILYAFEDIFVYCNELIAQGLKVSGIVSDYDAEFFPLHAVADIEHAATLRETMMNAAPFDIQWQECLRLVKQGAQLVYDMFVEYATYADKQREMYYEKQA